MGTVKEKNWKRDDEFGLGLSDFELIFIYSYVDTD